MSTWFGEDRINSTRFKEKRFWREIIDSDHETEFVSALEIDEEKSILIKYMPENADNQLNKIVLRSMTGLDKYIA